MVEAIFRQLGKPPRIISLPQPLLHTSVQLLHCIPTLRHISPTMLTRMNQDLCFDHREATQDFGYQPRRFSDNPMGFEHQCSRP